jgi:hypothetical protein
LKFWWILSAFWLWIVFIGNCFTTDATIEGKRFNVLLAVMCMVGAQTAKKGEEK